MPVPRDGSPTELYDCREIIGSARGGYLFKNRKIKLCIWSNETAAQVPPGISYLSGVFDFSDQ